MPELITFPSAIIVVICLIVLCYHVAAIKKELLKQSKFQSAILNRLEAEQAPNTDTFQNALYNLQIFDSKNRNFLVRNINSNGYEKLQDEYILATKMTSTKQDVTLEIIKQSGLAKELALVDISLNAGVNNKIDIAEYLA